MCCTLREEFIEFSDSPPWRTDGMDGLASEVLDAGRSVMGFFFEVFGGVGFGVCGGVAFFLG